MAALIVVADWRRVLEREVRSHQLFIAKILSEKVELPTTEQRGNCVYKDRDLLNGFQAGIKTHAGDFTYRILLSRLLLSPSFIKERFGVVWL